MISKDVIVVIRSSAIGDVVLSSALLDYLDALDRDIKVVWLGSQPSLSLVSSHPRMEAAIPVTSGDLFERMANYRDRVLSVVDLQANLRSIRLANSLSKFFSCKVFRWQKNSFERTKLVAKARFRSRSSKYPHYDYELKYLSMLSCFKRSLIDSNFVLNPSISAVPKIMLTDEEKEQFNPDNQLIHIGVCPGASYFTKKLPLDNWDRIVRSIAGLKGSKKISIFGAKSDLSDSQFLEEVCDKFGVEYENYTGHLNLRTTAIYLSKMNLFIGNDSGLGHISEALGVDSFVFFGPTVEEFGFTPWRSRSRVFSSDLGCRPCSKHGKNPCRFEDMLCFNGIDFDKFDSELINYFGE